MPENRHIMISSDNKNYLTSLSRSTTSRLNLSLNMQISRTYRLAISKALRETLEYLSSDNEENVDDPVVYELMEEMSDDEEIGPGRPTEYIEEQLEKYRQKRKEFYEETKKMTIEQLINPQGQVKDEL